MTPEVAVTKAWIETHLEPAKTIRNSRSSYKYKHIVEREAGIYIPNLTFIEVMGSMGFEMKRCYEGSPNYFFKAKLKKTSPYNKPIHRLHRMGYPYNQA